MTLDHVLEEARAHMKAAVLERELPFSLTPGWQHSVSNILLAVDAFETCQEAIHYAQDLRHTGFNHRRPADIALLRQKMEALRQSFPQVAEASLVYESPFANEDSVLELEGKRLSNIWFWHLRPILSTRELIADTVLEIGSGMGEMARLLYLMRQPRHIVLVDLPTSLFFAEIYLRLSLPETAIAYKGSQAASEAAILLVPVTRISEYKPPRFDLIFNCGSLQEMTTDARAWWLNYIRAYGNCFYSLNYAATPLLMDGWHLLAETLNPPMVIEDCVVDRESIWHNERR